MKFSEKWLREWVNPRIDSDELATELTMAGLEVTSITPVAPEFSHVVVGVVAEANRHPNADKLSVCRVNIGSPDELTIVCGASNVRAGLKVAVALIGASLPGDFKIKAAKLRGVESAGMLCSAKELGLDGDLQLSGIMELPDDAPLGVDLREYLSLNDKIIDIELTPNRGDCLCIWGIAREVAAIKQMNFNFPQLAKVTAGEESFPIKIIADDACPHYVGRIIRNINLQVKPPLWLSERLKRSGIRSINPVVDVANYVMLELGQPLHAFDLDKVDGEIQVRHANQGETLTLLDGSKIQLHQDSLIIADASRPLALAGIMGGVDSGVSEATTSIFLESAFFTPEKLAGVARNYGLQTDASYRFERGVDFNLQAMALERATDLLVAIVGGKAQAITDITYEKYLPLKREILLRTARIEQVLGVKIDPTDVKLILQRLGLTVQDNPDGWLVLAPSFRFDLAIEEDLIEEVARIYGYDQIPERAINTSLLPMHATTNIGKRLCELMVDLGYNEVINLAFLDANFLALIDPASKPVKLLNPISADRSVLRTTLVAGLLEVVLHNLRRQHQRLRFFETGLCFQTEVDAKFQQSSKLAAISVGDAFSEQWGMEKRAVDFFDLKQDLSRVLQTFGIDAAKLSYLKTSHPLLHPTRSARVYLGKESLGYIGELHPKIKQQLNIVPAVSVFEIDLSTLTDKKSVYFKNFSKFPTVTRDLAIIVSNEISWADLRQKIIDISGELLHSLQLFDIYCNESFGKDKKSIAVHLIFQHLTRSLQDEEVDALVETIVLTLKENFMATLRG